MKFFKLVLVIVFITSFNSTTFSEEKKLDCLEFKTDTIMSMIDKIRCKQGKEPREKISLGKKIKNFLKSKKKN
ncbi:MAG: hypothetical protein CMI82_00240 [Candidatus Pelagibacter sp.]|nr:hypothetical protein [Candidatus Pelagibacter sp.]